jgi:hypothetical protein
MTLCIAASSAVGSRFALDVFNVLNSNAPNALLYLSGPTYLYPTGVNGGILPARIARLTARFSF